MNGQEIHLPFDEDRPTWVANEQFRRWLRHANQWAERRMLAGPDDSEVAGLRRDYDYAPEKGVAIADSRLAWEEFYANLLRQNRTAPGEVRAAVQARELIHEHRDLFFDLLGGYGLSVERAFGADPDRFGSGRAALTRFFDQIPSMRVAVDLKTHIFRDPNRAWKINDVRDIDALGVAVPYCRVVVADSDMADRLRRSKVEDRHDVHVFHKLNQLAGALAPLVVEAKRSGGELPDWDEVGPGAGFRMDMPGPAPVAPRQRAAEEHQTDRARAVG
jgi:hypothetical protein